MIKRSYLFHRQPNIITCPKKIYNIITVNFIEFMKIILCRNVLSFMNYLRVSLILSDKQSENYKERT